MSSLKEQIIAAFKGGRSDLGELLIKAQGLDFSGIEIADIELTDTQLKKLSFSGARFSRVVLAESRIAECDFRGAVFEDCVFENCTLLSSVFDKAVFNAPVIRACRFERVSAVRADFGPKTDISDCVFSSCRLDGCRFDLETSLTRTVIEKTCTERAVFNEVVFRDVSMLESSFSLSGFVHAVFVRPKIEGSYFRRSLFQDCKWDGAKISRSNFAGASGLDANAGLDLTVFGSNSNRGPMHSCLSRWALVCFVAAVAGVVLWSLIFNPIFMSSPRLAEKSVRLLDNGRYLDASRHIRVLARRHKELPAELVERMADIGIENLALILSRDIAKNAVDESCSALVRVMTAELDWNGSKRPQALEGAKALLGNRMSPVVRKRLLLNIAFWSLEQEDLAGAETAANALIELNYDSSSVAGGYLVSGQVLLARGRAGQALEMFEKSLALETDTRKRATLASRMSRLYLDRGETDRVMALVGETGLTDQARIKRIHAQVFVCRGDNDAALRELNGALGLARDAAARISILLSLAHIYIETEEYEQARGVMKQIVGEDMSADTMAEINGMNAVLERVDGNLETSRKLYETAVTLTSNVNILNWLYLDLARVYLDLSMKEQALGACRKVEDFAVAPVFAAEAKEIRASVYFKDGNSTLGIALLEGALDLAKAGGGSNDTADNIRISLARICRDSGNRRRLDELCAEVLKNNATGDRAAEALAMMAEAADRDGESSNALSLFQKAFDTARDEGLRVWCGLELARLMYESGDREQAVTLVSEIIKDSKREDSRLRAERMLDGFKKE